MEHERVRLPLYGIMSTRIGLVLIALVAMIGMVVGMAPLQLSGEVGKNISANLTDDVAFHVGKDSPTVTSWTMYYSGQEAANAEWYKHWPNAMDGAPFTA
jgi:hypothetical protein